MNINFAHIVTALDRLKNEVGYDNIKNVTMEVTLVEDDPGSGKMIECLTFKCSKTVNPAQYDDYKSPTSYEYTMELFAESEKRSPRLTTVQTRDLDKKEERR